MIETAKILIALALPLCLALFLARGEVRRFVGFFTAGLLCAFLAVHINSFLAAASGMEAMEALVKLTPINEEILKALPVFLYLLAIRNPERGDAAGVALAVGLGFVTYENCYLLVQLGGGDLLLTLIRGLAAGFMHVSCAVLLGYGLSLLLNHRYMLLPGAFGLLCIQSLFHATYNLLVTASSGWQGVGYALPLAMAAALLLWRGKMGTESE